MVHSSCPEVTHNIVHELTLTPFCMLALLKSNVVSPKWLAEVIHRGTESNRSSILEQHFELPDTSSYLPAVSAALPSTLKSTDFWITGTSRRGVLDSYRFIIFTGNSENVEDLQSVISVSGGGYELFPVDSGRIRLHRRLSADKDKRQKVIIIDDEVKASVAPDTWNELIDEAKSSVSSRPLLFLSLNDLKRFELSFCSREKVLETIVVGEPSVLNHYTGLHQFLFIYPILQFDIHVTAPRVAGISSQSHQGGSLQGHDEGSPRPKRLTRRTTPSTHASIDRERSSEVEPPQVRRVGSVIWIMNCSNSCVPGAHSPSQSWFSASYGRRFRYSGCEQLCQGRFCTTNWD